MSKQYCAKHVFHYSPNHIINVICPRREIDRLKAELNEAAERLGKVIQENGLLQNRVQNWPNLFDENMRLQTQLSEARAELEVSKLHCATLSERYNELERQLAEAKTSAEAWQENCRLTEEELEKERNKHADIIGKLAERDGAITCYNEVLAELREEVATLRQQSINWVPVFDENMELQIQNAALRGEVGRLKQNIVATLTERLSNVDTARKQTAGEICDYLQRSSTDDEISKGYVIDHIKRRYGLEG